MLISLLGSRSIHNRRVAAEALGRLGDKSAVPALLDAAAAPNDRVLEHSLTYALIEIAAPPLRRGALVPAVDAILDRFLPANCRYRLAFVAADGVTTGRHLDDDAVLADGSFAELGRTAVVGHAALAAPRGGLGTDIRLGGTSQLT